MIKLWHGIVGLALTGGILAVAQTPAAIPVNGVVAIVHDTVITHGDVMSLADPVLESLAIQYRDRPQMFEQKRMETLQFALNTLIERKLILHDFQTSGYNLPESVIDEEIKDRIRSRFGDRVRLINTLKQQGRTYESFRREVRELIIEEALRAKHVALEIIISPYKIEAYYATNQAQYAVEDQVKLRMIRLIPAAAAEVETAKKKGLGLLSQIDAGTAFTNLTGHHQGSQPGGDWGWVTSTTLSRGLTDIFFKLKAGQHTGLIGRGNESDRTYWVYQYDKDGRLTSARKYGVQEGKEVFLEARNPDDPAASSLPLPQEFYLLYVEEARGSHIRSLTEMRADIERNLVAEERARLQKKWIDRLKAKTYVQRF